MNQQKPKLEIRQNRHFSEEFKRQKVKELCAKQVTITQLCKLYKVSSTSVYKWLYKYSPNHQPGTTLVLQMESESQKTILLLQRVAELERVVGQKQLELDFLNELLRVGSEELGFDLKKNFSTAPLNGSAAPVKSTTATP